MHSVRKNTEVHHSATHLLHAALRKILGKHVAQKGSLVNHEHLRFDFSHFAKVTEAEIAAIEKLVNEKIRENIPVVVKEMSKDEAIAQGAMALFGEKYGERVRVVIIDSNYSVELCGGTHVGSTGELGFCKIIHETAVAAGVRRLEAVSGDAAEQWVTSQLEVLQQVKDTLNNPRELLKAIDNLQTENAALKKKMESLATRQLSIIRTDLLQKIEMIGSVQFIGQVVEVNNSDSVKKLCLSLKDALQNAIVVLAANVEGKAAVALMIDEQLVSANNLDAVRIIKDQIATVIKGGGGGQKTMATAGGQDAGNLLLAINKVKSLVESL